MKTIKFLNKLVIAILTILAIWLIIKSQVNYKNEKLTINKNHAFTVGKLVNYRLVGDIETRYLTYGYEVEGKLYERTVTTFQDYDYCYKQKWKCKDLRFWVVFSSDNPEISLIDLTREIQGIENPPFPTTLDSFK